MLDGICHILLFHCEINFTSEHHRRPCFCFSCFVFPTDDSKAQREPHGPSAPEPPRRDRGGTAGTPGRRGLAGRGHHKAGAARSAGAAGGGAAQGAGEAGRAAGAAFQTGKKKKKRLQLQKDQSRSIIIDLVLFGADVGCVPGKLHERKTGNKPRVAFPG